MLITFSLKLETRKKILSVTYSIQHYAKNLSQCNMARKRKWNKSVKIGIFEIKLSLLVYSMIVYVKIQMAYKLLE
jgi:hypothetical protein